jgi:hypothetical protein
MACPNSKKMINTMTIRIINTTTFSVSGFFKARDLLIHTT